jgi:crossover junction endodeoxyribonuclease RuvC
MVTYLLGLAAKPQADAADALAVALCHNHTQQSLIKMSGQVKKTVRGRLR